MFLNAHTKSAALLYASGKVDRTQAASQGLRLLQGKHSTRLQLPTSRPSVAWLGSGHGASLWWLKTPAGFSRSHPCETLQCSGMLIKQVWAGVRHEISASLTKNNNKKCCECVYVHGCGHSSGQRTAFRNQLLLSTTGVLNLDLQAWQQMPLATESTH